MRHPTNTFNLDRQSYNHTSKTTDAERQPNKKEQFEQIIPSGCQLCYDHTAYSAQSQGRQLRLSETCSFHHHL